MQNIFLHLAHLSPSLYLKLLPHSVHIIGSFFIYRSIEEIQADLDEFMAWYNTERTNQGHYCKGRTPLPTLTDELALYDQYVYDIFEGKEAA